MSHEDTSKLTIEERRRRATAIFNQLNKPGTITRALVDLHRSDGPTGRNVAREFPALANVTARMRKIDKALRAASEKK